MTAAMLVIAGFTQIAQLGADELAITESARRAGKAEIASVLSNQQLQSIVDTILRWEKLPRPARMRLATELCPALHTTALVRPINTAGLTIPYRVKTGELKPVGLGGLRVRHDLFLSGGRAAWAISKLIGADDLPTLDGGLTAGEWNERALAIEAKVKAFAKGPVRPVARVPSSGERPPPHPFPAVQGVMAFAPLLSTAPGPWPVPKIVLLVEAQLVNEFLTGRNWPRLPLLLEEMETHGSEARARIAERLAISLRRMNRVPLEMTDGLEIPYRVKTGEMKAAPDGVIMKQDLFLEGGRASWALYSLTGGGGTIPLHGGLTVDEWNTRAALMETHVKRFVENNTPVKK